METPKVFGEDGQGHLHPNLFIQEADIIAAGPLVKQDSVTVAYRVVLRWDGNSFVVHDQCFPNFPNDLSESYYHQGSYCGVNLAQALHAFATRLGTFADHCGALKRPTAKAA